MNIRTDRIIVIGGGWLGQAIAVSLGVRVVRVDIADADAVQEMLEREYPNLIINAAGNIGRPSTRACQASVEAMLATDRSNTQGPLVLARLCWARGIALVHLSTASVFEGTRQREGGFTERDVPNPKGPTSWYGTTKYRGELAMVTAGALAVRFHMPFGNGYSDRSPIDRMKGYPYLTKAVNSLTYVPDFLEGLKKLIVMEASGIVHLVNPEPVSNDAIMAVYRDKVDQDYAVPVVPESVGIPGIVLSGVRAAALGITMRPTLQALQEHFESYR